MTRKTALLGTSKLTMAALVAAGLTAMPVAITGGGQVVANNALAAEDFLEPDEAFVERGAGETDISKNVFRILGTTQEEVGKEVMSTTATTSAGPLPEYKTAVRRADLERSAEVLAAVSNRPITERLVLELNDALGLETTLTAHQIAAEAAARQDPKNLAMVPAIDSYDETGEVNTNKRILEEDYEQAMTRGNLDAAADALAKGVDQEITEKLVLYVNRRLGVESTLTAKQVAIAAAKRQREM